MRLIYWSSISNLVYTRNITQKLRATSGEDHLRNLARQQLSFELQRNMASHWRWPWTALNSIWQVGYRTPDLWLWKRYRYCYTNQPITNPSCGRTYTSKFTRQQQHVQFYFLHRVQKNSGFCLYTENRILYLVSCKTNLDLLLMCYWYALMAETALPVQCNKKIEQHWFIGRSYKFDFQSSNYSIF